MLLPIPGIQRSLELLTCMIIASFCRVVVVFGSSCLKEPSSEGLSRTKAENIEIGRTLEHYSSFVTA